MFIEFPVNVRSAIAHLWHGSAYLQIHIIHKVISQKILAENKNKTTTHRTYISRWWIRFCFMHNEEPGCTCALQTVKAKSVTWHWHSHTCTKRNVNLDIRLLRMDILAKWEKRRSHWSSAHTCVASHVDEGEETNGVSCACRWVNFSHGTDVWMSVN